MNIKGKKVLVFGSGISGTAAGRLLLSQGARVVLYDGNVSLDKEKIHAQIASGTAGEVEVLLGELPLEVLDSLSLTVISPGVPTDLPIVEEMRRRKIPIWGEIELAYVFGKGEVQEQMVRQQQRRCLERL